MEAIHLWTGASCRYWNHDFRLKTCHLFDLQKWTIHTCEVMILEGTLTSSQQPPGNGPSPLGWPAESPCVKIGWPSMCSGMESSWDRSRSFRNQEAVSCRQAIRIIWTPSDWVTFCRTWGTILNSGNAYRKPLPLSQGTDRASVNSALGSGYGDANLMRRLLAKVTYRSTCGSPHLANTGRGCSMAIIHSVFSVWPTLDSESAWMLLTPGRWTGTSFIAKWSHHFSRRIVTCMRVKDRVPHSVLMYATVTALSHIKRTTRDLRWSQGRKALTVLMTTCISRTFMCDNLWDADHSPCVECDPNWAPQPELDASVKRVTSVSLEARGRPCRTATDAHQSVDPLRLWQM